MEPTPPPHVTEEDWIASGEDVMCDTCPAAVQMGATASDGVPCPYWVKGLPCPEDEPLAVHA